ncbi:MAG: ribose-phosphate diphosphokinase, partial [Actinobacteria bacterium]|nr:ribose-phosphate diphosphokinase [Actinomycetota bacterium]
VPVFNGDLNKPRKNCYNLHSPRLARQIKREVDELVILDVPEFYLGSVGAYYEEFSPVEDERVIAILKGYPYPSIDPALYTFPSHKYMIKNLKQITNLTLGKFALDRFPNNELCVKLQTHTMERDCIVLGNIAPPDSNLVSFLLLCHTLQKENAYKITALLPYLAYSRADKKEPQKSYTTDLIGKLLSTSGVNEVITVDIHSPHVNQLFPIPLISLSPSRIFADEIKKKSLQNATNVSPDEGAIRRCEKVAKQIRGTSNIAFIEKKRLRKGIKHLGLHGAVGQQAVIVDDILDTGKTLISACEILLKKGAKEIYIMVTHGLFTGNEWKKLWELRVKHIYCTDSISLPKHATSENITVLSIIPLLIEELQEEHKGIFEIDTKDKYSFYDYDEV